MENVRRYRVYPSVKPGYLKDMVPETAPEKPENWDDIIADIDRVIVPGVSPLDNLKDFCIFPRTLLGTLPKLTRQLHSNSASNVAR